MVIHGGMTCEPDRMVEDSIQADGVRVPLPYYGQYIHNSRLTMLTSRLWMFSEEVVERMGRSCCLQVA
jgi:hypothetical protein